MKRVWLLVGTTAVAVVLVFVIQVRQPGLTLSEVFSGGPSSLADRIEATRETALVGERIDFLIPMPVGPAVGPDDRPLIANVAAADLDGDGLTGLDGDGDLDLSVAQFGYDQGETRWMENVGGWRFESHVLQTLSGAINADIADVDGDGDLDIVSLVSQEWEEIYVFVNDGHGEFTPTRVFGASNEDFGSSWISLADLDRDGDVDVLYSNGDAFDYAPPTGRNWNGVQWLENRGGVRFVYHRIGDFSGASDDRTH